MRLDIFRIAGVATRTAPGRAVYLWGFEDKVDTTVDAKFLVRRIRVGKSSDHRETYLIRPEIPW